MSPKNDTPIYLLAIDNGTQSVRALIFDQFGTEIAKARVPIEPYFSTQLTLPSSMPTIIGKSLARPASSCGNFVILSRHKLLGLV